MRCSVAITPNATVSAAMNEKRRRYDAHYAAVVPHLTVAFPAPYTGALAALQAQLAALIQPWPAFTATFDRWASSTELLAQYRTGTDFLMARYPNAVNLIVLLVGEGADDILGLRRALSGVIPQPPHLLDYPPYGTLGQTLSDAAFAEAKAELADFRPHYQFDVTHLDFYAEQPDGAWPIVDSFALARP
jgi:2'-5' RNA ligase